MGDGFGQEYWPGANTIDWDKKEGLLPEDRERFHAPKRLSITKRDRWITSRKFIIVRMYIIWNVGSVSKGHDT